jgi:hypothetical protein
MIHDFAFFVLSSSPHESKYINPLITKAKTAITATNCIACHIRLVISSSPILFPITAPDGFIGFESLHPGSQIQFTDGAPAKA